MQTTRTSLRDSDVDVVAFIGETSFAHDANTLMPVEQHQAFQRAYPHTNASYTYNLNTNRMWQLGSRGSTGLEFSVDPQRRFTSLQRHQSS